MIIWLQSSPPHRCPSDHQKRRSSCAGHLSGTAPVFTHTTNVTNVHQYRCGMAANSFSELSIGGCSFLWCLWLMGEGQQRAMCELQPVSSCKKMARQPGFSPPPPPPPCGCESLPSQHCIYHTHAPLGFSNWFQQTAECMMKSALIRHVHLYITSLIWLSTLPAFCVNMNCIHIWHNLKYEQW